MATPNRDAIVQFCEQYLKTSEFSAKDDCQNGLQVEGKAEIRKIVTGVSWSQILFEQAIEKKADMILVHHGIFANSISNPPQIKGTLKNRLKLLLKNDLNLCGFHLPLDAHPTIGNNSSLCKLLGIKKLKPIDVGFYGDLDKETNFSDFVKNLEQKLGTQAIIIAAGKDKVRQVGVLSGGASTEVARMKELGVDVFITGDIREHLVREIEELKINFINAGHYNTEKLGIQNLGQLVAKKFKIDVEYIDVPCHV